MKEKERRKQQREDKKKEESLAKKKSEEKRRQVNERKKMVAKKPSIRRSQCTFGASGESSGQLSHSVSTYTASNQDPNQCTYGGASSSGESSVQPSRSVSSWRASEASETLFSHVYGNSRYIYIYICTSVSNTHARV